VPLILQQQISTVQGVPDKDRLVQFPNPLSGLRTPGERDPRASQLPDAEDEMVVNAAAVTLLQALLHLTPCCPSDQLHIAKTPEVSCFMHREHTNDTNAPPIK
jgi:hypothetical protein